MKTRSKAKKGSKKDQEPGDRKILLVIGLVLVAMLYFVFGRDKDSLVKTGNFSSKAPVSRSNAAAARELEERPSGAPQPGLAQAESFSRMLAENNVRRISTESAGGKLLLKVRPMPQVQHCKPGDFDLMKNIPAMPRDKVFTISLESLNRPAVKVTHTVSVDDMVKAATLTSPIPFEDDAFGLYICSNGTPGEGCAKKEPLPPTVWNKSDNEMREGSKNKVLYFQMLIVRNEAVFLVPGQNWGNENLNKMKTSMSSFLGDDAKHLKTMERFLSILRPFPAFYVDKTIEIPLPYSDNNCR